MAGIARPDGSLMRFGGLGADFLPRAQAWQISRSAVQVRAALPSPRDLHSVTLLGDGRVLILGGLAPGSNPLNQARIYD